MINWVFDISTSWILYVIAKLKFAIWLSRKICIQGLLAVFFICWLFLFYYDGVSQLIFYFFLIQSSGGRMGELDKASLGDRGTSWSEFDSPGEHSCSHIRALPLHIQLHLFLPCTAHIRTPRGTKMMVLPSLSSTQTTPNNIYTAHENAQNRKQYTVSRCKKVIYHWRPDVCNIADAPNSTNTNTNSKFWIGIKF
jgi:hypothetical protein